MTKTILSIVGGIVLTLALLGTFGIGHFRLYYGVHPFSCMKEPV
jgi:hypothetical protein